MKTTVSVRVEILSMLLLPYAFLFVLGILYSIDQVFLAGDNLGQTGSVESNSKSNSKVKVIEEIDWYHMKCLNGVAYYEFWIQNSYSPAFKPDQTLMTCGELDK